MRILVVEDDKKIASFVVKGLKEASFAVDFADNGEEGLHLALSEPYDAAVMDVMLPELDGLSVIAQPAAQDFDPGHCFKRQARGRRSGQGTSVRRR